MFLMPSLIVFLFLTCAGLVVSVCPEPYLVKPHNGTILSASLVRVAVEPDTDAAAVEKVVFNAGCYKSIDVLKRKSHYTPAVR